MLCIDDYNENPEYNLACDEFLFKEKQDAVFRLWTNKPCVIIGKHQNLMSEVNHFFLRKNRIPVIRRISGGGAVYHDAGNLNYSVITNGMVNFDRVIRLFRDYLLHMGLIIKAGKRNDLFIEERKISGNAAHYFKGRVLHHGTLLFSANLENLNAALEGRPDRYNGIAVKSVRSSVANIHDYLQEGLDFSSFRRMLFDFIKNKYPGAVSYSFNNEEREKTARLAAAKYGTWEWNYGYSPHYIFHNCFMMNEESFEIRLVVEKGIIQDAGIHCGISGRPVFNELDKCLKGVRHEYSSVIQVVADNFRQYNFRSFAAEFFADEMV